MTEIILVCWREQNCKKMTNCHWEKLFRRYHPLHLYCYGDWNVGKYCKMYTTTVVYYHCRGYRSNTTIVVYWASHSEEHNLIKYCKRTWYFHILQRLYNNKCGYLRSTPNSIFVYIKVDNAVLNIIKTDA